MKEVELTLCPDPPRIIRKDFLEEAAFEMDLKGFLQVEKEKTQAEDLKNHARDPREGREPGFISWNSGVLHT